jgi:predicted short-subunit dehydrogenase-like oxidoreductase (DUF2520 family)
MLRGMRAESRARPGIAIVGAGNLASALAAALLKSGYPIDQVISHGDGASLRAAKRLAREVHAVGVTATKAQIDARVVWFCVPDSVIAAAAQSLSRATTWRGKVAFHSSGALTSDELAVLREKGASVASVHPLTTFVRDSRPTLAEIPFAIEGDLKAVRVARAIVRDLGARPYSIRKRDKQLYHAWGMFVSPLFTALLAMSENIAVAASVSRKSARERMLPILRQTIDNYARLGAPGSFSGPIARGDVATVEKHLRVLRKIREARDIYVALARAALRNLPAKNRDAMANMLK